MRASVIYNPLSGKGRGQAAAEASAEHLERRGFQVSLHPTTGPRHATSLACELAPQSNVVVAVGGDGTINEVVTGMLEATGDTPGLCRLGIVPLGTVNVVARELELPFRTKEACAVIAAGKSMPLDVGKVNDRRFVLMTGAGIDAVTIRNIDLRVKRWLRSLAFAGTGLTKGLTHQHPEFEVTVDDTTHRATFFVAGNFHYYAAHLSMTPGADPTDGLLDMMLFHGTNKRSVLAFWARVLLRKHVHGDKVTCLRARRAELRPLGDSETVWLQADGEIVGQLPATVEITPAVIEVLVP